ncbi:hypothetical protein [Corynebacterium auriscanis]|uniref:hypothetical protein n=1 Tax=Corynebacterium auriscanis TaxID=99807 RepID=UPI0024AD9F01|nr:hypothetical protein [Corynebacterium auriscanis]
MAKKVNHVRDDRFDILLPELRPYFVEALAGQGQPTIYGGKLTYAKNGLQTED